MIELYESQRVMRSLRQAAMQRGVVAVLDIGTSKLACLVLRFEPTQDTPADGVGSLAGQSGFRVIGMATTQSRGVRRGEIVRMSETESAIRTVIRAAQKLAQVRVDHVIACFSGGTPQSYALSGEVPLANGPVTERDIARVLNACQMPVIGEDRKPLHAQPVNFAVDNRSQLHDPRGQAGQTLTTDMHLVTVDAASIRSLAGCLRQCDLELAGVASSAYVSSVSSLVEDEQELGAVCIDMGAGATGLSMFLHKHMIYSDAVPIGGDLVTSDISVGLQISHAKAEWIKTRHGGLVATGRDDSEMIEIGGETGDWEHDRRTVSRAELIGIMRPRVEEILEAVHARLQDVGFDQLPSRQIVLTGGGSQIPGLDMMARHILGQQVRLGRPMRINGLPQAASGPGFAGVVGLSLFAAHPQDECWDFQIPHDSAPVRSLRRAMRWFRENW